MTRCSSSARRSASGDFGKVKVGENVVVTVDALPGFVTEGEVNRIAPQVDARSRSFEIIIRVPGKPQLVSGLFARAQVKVRDVPNSLTVPPAALLRDGSDPTKAQTYRGREQQSRAARRDWLASKCPTRFR